MRPPFREYGELFDFLSAPSLPTQEQPAIVFGRSDPIVAHKLVDLAADHLVSRAVITGGVGKDTGDLLQRGFSSEADFLGKEAESNADSRGVALPKVALDEKAANGAQNAENGLRIHLANDPKIVAVTGVIHATSARRLSEQIKWTAANIFNLGADLRVNTAPSNYQFDPTREKDRKEALNEYKRLLDYPEQGLLLPQTELPDNLTDFVMSILGDQEIKPVKAWQSTLLRLAPPKVQLAIIKIAEKRGRM